MANMGAFIEKLLEAINMEAGIDAADTLLVEHPESGALLDIETFVSMRADAIGPGPEPLWFYPSEDQNAKRVMVIRLKVH